MVFNFFSLFIFDLGILDIDELSFFSDVIRCLLFLKSLDQCDCKIIGCAHRTRGRTTWPVLCVIANSSLRSLNGYII